MFEVRSRVGRLVEVELRSPVSEAEMDSADLAMASVVARLGGRAVICADYTGTSVLSPVLTDRLVAMFRKHAPSIERSAVFVSPESASAILQIERVIREASHPARKAFRNANELVAWLRESLTETEQVRLREILPVATSTRPRTLNTSDRN